MTPHDPNDWPPVRMVESESELEAALEEWAAAGVLGVDTESNSFYAYTDRLCLVQVSTAEQDYIVDPVALGDALRGFAPLLGDESITKIFHAAEFDLMLLKKDLDADVRGLFDTQVAMTLLQHERTGLASLIESYYGIKPSKKEQRSNWGKRPLTNSQIAYARVDTHFLPDLHQSLAGELAEKNLVDAAHGEFARLEVEVLPPREPDFEGWRRMKGARGLDGEEAARLRGLFQWRERTAQERDKPVFRVMANETLVDLARKPPRDGKDLGQRKGVGWGVAKRDGEAILAALAEAAGTEVEMPKAAPATPLERRIRRLRRDNQDALRKWRKGVAESLGLPSERLIHRRHLEEVGRKLPRTSEDLLRTIPLNDWQREHLESSLLELLSTLPDPEQAAKES